MIWNRLAEFVLRDVDWPETFRVKWVVLDNEPLRSGLAGVAVVAGYVNVSAQLLGVRGNWREWPSVHEQLEQAFRRAFSG